MCGRVERPGCLWAAPVGVGEPKAPSRCPAAIDKELGSQLGRFLIRLSENWHLGNRYAPENFEHMAEKISLRYVEIRGLFGFRCT